MFHSCKSCESCRLAKQNAINSHNGIHTTFCVGDTVIPHFGHLIEVCVQKWPQRDRCLFGPLTRTELPEMFEGGSGLFSSRTEVSLILNLKIPSPRFVRSPHKEISLDLDQAKHTHTHTHTTPTRTEHAPLSPPRPETSHHRACPPVPRLPALRPPARRDRLTALYPPPVQSGKRLSRFQLRWAGKIAFLSRDFRFPRLGAALC